MTGYRKAKSEERVAWNQAVNHPLQSWEWGEFRATRQPIDRLVKHKNEKIIKAFLVVYSKIPLTQSYFGFVPMSEFPDEEDLLRIEQLAREKGAVGVRFEPIGPPTGEPSARLAKGRGLFKKKTLIWDLSQSEEEMKKRLKPKCRYNIGVAIRHGVKIKEDNQKINDYLELLFDGTAKRQRVAMHDKHYHQSMFDLLNKAGMARLFVAEYAGQTIAAMVVFVFKGWGYYAYGANSLRHKETMAATLLMWETARQLKAEGVEKFDLWGTEEGKGFGRFKEQFGAEEAELPGAFDLPINRFGYNLFRLVEEIRWRARHI